MSYSSEPSLLNPETGYLSLCCPPAQPGIMALPTQPSSPHSGAFGPEPDHTLLKENVTNADL